MTLQDLIANVSQTDIRVLLAVFAAPPVIAFLLGILHGRGGASPWRYCYSMLIYLVCLPGIFAGVLVAYSMFFLRQNLLTVNILVYFLPLACMAATLAVIHQRVDMNRLPGVDRIYALMVMVAVSMAVALAIMKTRIWIVFGGSIASLGIIALICFLLLRWAFGAMLGKGDGDGEPDNGRFHADRELDRLKRRMRMK